MPDLASLAQSVWDELNQAPASPTSPFLLGVLGTTGAQGGTMRTVVVREVVPTERTILCHSDARAHKIHQLSAGNRIQWLFYDGTRRLQIIASGTGKVHQRDALARSQWERTSVTGRVHYCVTSPPGTELPAAGTGLPVHWGGKLPNPTEVEFGYAQFAVIVTVVDSFEWLQIGAEGPIKAQFDWRDGGWQGRWIVP